MKRSSAVLVLFAALTVQVLGQGSYVEFKMTGTDGVSGTTRAYSQDGNSRSEIDMASPQAPGGMHWVNLIQKANPQKSFSLNVNAKTYSETDMSTDFKRESDSTRYEVTVLGTEKVNGYNATHVRVRKVNAPNEENIWVSTGIPDYKKYMKVKSKYTTEGLFKAISAKGALGFPVRTVASERGKTIQIDLVRIEARNNNPALFSLAGYTKAGTPGGTSGDIEMMKKVQSMSPEERRKFIEELRKKQAASQAK